MSKKHLGNFLGICVANNDPEKTGRIKVFVPHVTATIYEGWNNVITDKKFKFPDKDTNPDLYNVLLTLKETLPWATCAMPLFGGGASGKYNAVLGKGSTSDSNAWNRTTPVEGFRPARAFAGTNSHPDAFNEAGKYGNREANPYSWEYTPSDYSGLPQGMFNIPKVGAHVWVFFEDGDPQFPVYFAISHGQEEWKRIYTLNQAVGSDNGTTDYPGAYENIDPSEGGKIDPDSKTFKAKTVLNSSKHVVELIDTDLREILKMTHYSGSFKEFNNYSNIELATKHDQRMVLGNQFQTTWGNKSSFVGKNKEDIIRGDHYITIGSATPDKVKSVIDEIKNIHEFKRLFDVMRADWRLPPREVSNYQAMMGSGFIDLEHPTGSWKVCPVCGGLPYIPDIESWVLKASYLCGGLLTPGNIAEMIKEVLGTGILATTDTISQLNILATPETLGIYPIDIPAMLALGFFDSLLALNGLLGIYLGSPCDVCNPLGDITMGKDPITQLDIPLITEPGLSPSTYDGNWMIDFAKGTTLDPLIVAAQAKIVELERGLEGGDKIEIITRNKFETIGLGINDLRSFKVDPRGKIRIDGVHVALEGTYDTFRPSPHVEYVDVDDIPGGDYNLTVGNKYKLLVGARGINIKTFGPLDMYGTIMNINADQMNISSKNEITIDGGERLAMRGRKIALMPWEHNPVVIEGQMHVSRNAIIEGGMYVEGELGVQHITAPAERKITEYSGIASPEPNSIAFVAQVVNTLGESIGVALIPCHAHIYESIASTLTMGPEETRDSMMIKGINSTQRLVAASPIGGLDAAADPVALGIARAIADPIAAYIISGAAYYGLAGAPVTTVSGKVRYTFGYNYPCGSATCNDLYVSVEYTIPEEGAEGVAIPVSAKWKGLAVDISRFL